MSLIEVMMAGALLSVGAAAVISGWSTVVGILEHQRRLGEATNIVRSQLDMALGLPAGDPALSNGTHARGTVDVFNKAAPVGGRGYTVEVNVVENKPANGYIEVTVVARWTDMGRPRSTSLTSYRER